MLLYPNQPLGSFPFSEFPGPIVLPASGVTVGCPQLRTDSLHYCMWTFTHLVAVRYRLERCAHSFDDAFAANRSYCLSFRTESMILRGIGHLNP